MHKLQKAASVVERNKIGWIMEQDFLSQIMGSIYGGENTPVYGGIPRNYLNRELSSGFQGESNNEEEMRRQKMIADAQRADEERRSRIPSYSEAMAEFELDPLTQLYTGRKYAETPMSKEEYDYMLLSRKYGQTNEYGQPAVNARLIGEADRTPYDPQGGQPPVNEYAYYKWLQRDLKKKNEERLMQQREMQRQQSVANNQFQQFNQRSSGLRTGYLPGMKTQNDLQSLAARGFYQTPYSYQNY